MKLERPLLWIACGWVLGMIVASGYGPPWIAGGAAAAGAAAWAWIGANRKGAAAALLLAAAAIVGGGWYERYEALSVSAVPLPDDAEVDATVRGAIASDPLVDGDRIVFDVSATLATIGGDEVPLPGERIKAYVRFDERSALERASALRRGDGASIVGRLRRPLPATNFGGFDYRAYLERQRTYWTIHAEGPSGLALAEAPRSFALSFLAAVDGLRADMGKRIEAQYDPPVDGFMKGLLLGVQDDLDPELYGQFSRLGLTHILAISGLNVALYVGAVLWLLKPFPLTKETRLLVAFAAVPAYVLVTGASPSVVRAGIMAMIALYAARRGLLKDGLHVLAAAAVSMLAWNPYYLHDVGFQLSFLVTAALIVGVPLVDELLPIRRRAMRSAVAVTIVAQLASFPLTVTYFNGFSLLSFPANFVIVPLFSLAVLPLGTVGLLLSYASPWAAEPPAAAADWLAKTSFEAVRRLHAIEGAATIWATPPSWWVPAYYGVLFAAFASATGRLWPRATRWATTAPACALFCGLLAFAYWPDAFDRTGTVSFLDVGQGDAIWIRTPSGKHVLIDGGGTIRFEKPGEDWKRRNDPFEVGEDVVVPLLKRRGVQTIDALFVSHADADHIGGLQAVLEEIPVRRVFFNGTVKEGEASERLYRTALSQNVPFVPLGRGMTVEADERAAFRVLYPPRESKLRIEAEQNEISLVLLLTMHGRSFLFTGDIGAAGETAVLDEEDMPGAIGEKPEGTQANEGTEAGGRRVDVMKVAHHGSRTSTTEAWVDAWKPRLAVISAGRNNIYGHPHPAVIARLRDNGIPPLGTYERGEIQFRVTPDGSLSVRTKLNPASGSDF